MLYLYCKSLKFSRSMLYVNLLKRSTYKWSVKIEKNKKVLCLYFNHTSFILIDFCWNEVYLKYTSDEFDKK